MPLPSAPVRFALEAMILLGVAFVLSIADLGLGPFVLLMALTWLAVAAGERVASSATATPARTVPTDAESEALPVHADTEEPDSAVAPRRSPFEVLREKEEQQEQEEQEEEAALPSPSPAPVPAEPIAAELESEPTLPEEVAPSLPRGPERKPTPEPAPVAGTRPEPRREKSPAPRLAVSREPAPRRVVRGDRNPEPSRQQARIDARGTSQSRWNIWELERLARELAGQDPWRDEEWTALFVHLREFADPDGMLPPEFDGLVRESFGSLISA